ncbi:hypothetical protein [Neobacillus drentensis]|uniref:hypothetical protein n=1 Tax=Neobacillus drentensis TaxID=220684 RepID=UPI002FFFCB46
MVLIFKIMFPETQPSFLDPGACHAPDFVEDCKIFREVGSDRIELQLNIVGVVGCLFFPL